MSSSQNKAAESLFILEIKADNKYSFNIDAPDYIRKLGYIVNRYECHGIKDSNPFIMAFYIFNLCRKNSADIFICTEYRRSFILNLFLIILSKKSLHVVFGMNLSARPIISRYDFLNRLISNVFNRSSKIVVHSIYEATLFSDLHQLPMSRFVFSHWGYDLPAADSNRFQDVEKPFVCMIGRNNRDLDTFAEAVKLAGVRGVAVIPSYIDVKPELEAALEIHRELPFADCIDCIRNAAINLTLLRDDDRGAGHITVVTALHLGVPQIHSDAKVLQEYVPLRYLSYPVPIGDASAAADAIRMGLAAQLPDVAERRRAFAKRWLSHTSATRRAHEIILALVEGRTLPLTDDKWDDWLREATTNDLAAD